MKLMDEVRKQLIASLRRYFAEEWDQEIGDLKSSLLLDYFLAEVAPSVYNAAIQDAQKFFQEKTTDLDGVLYEPEFGYWEDPK